MMWEIFRIRIDRRSIAVVAVAVAVAVAVEVLSMEYL
jgi:hypothetical protein